ncbi:MAG: NAD(P)/FAD-dependent oxidoreductase, partial [Planctomycetota bacterium]
MAAHRVVVVGGGFAGLAVAQGLKRADAQITLIDRQNYHLFQPLLYQVATGGLSPANIATPLRAILRRQKNATVLQGEVFAMSGEQCSVSFRCGLTGETTTVNYDTLVVATGAGHHYFGNDHYEPLAPGLKTIQDATEIRARILSAFEAAELATSEEDQRRRMTFVVVGAGPTGLELSGTIAELARQTLPSEFRNVDTSLARVLLVEGQDRVLPTYPERLSESAARQLEKIGVTVRTSTLVNAIDESTVELKEGDRLETVATECVFWAAGVKASPLADELAKLNDSELDRAGRVAVDLDCSLPGVSNVFVLGDMASFTDASGKVLPGTAAVAGQQGKHVARQIRRRLAGQSTQEFRYRDLGEMA